MTQNKEKNNKKIIIQKTKKMGNTDSMNKQVVSPSADEG